MTRQTPFVTAKVNCASDTSWLTIQGYCVCRGDWAGYWISTIGETVCPWLLPDWHQIVYGGLRTRKSDLSCITRVASGIAPSGQLVHVLTSSGRH